MNFRLFLFSDQSLFAELVTRGFPSKWITPYKGVRCKVFPSCVSIFLRIFQDGPIPRWVVDYYRKVRSSDLSCQDLRGLRISFTNWPLKIYFRLKFLLHFVQNRKYGARGLFTREAENFLKTLLENSQTFLRLISIALGLEEPPLRLILELLISFLSETVLRLAKTLRMAKTNSRLLVS